MFDYDVIVIGAGPAGCSAAARLAQKGCYVLLAEKMDMPRTKSCSGILIQKSLKLVEEYFGGLIPEYTHCSPADNRGMVFVNDAGWEYKFEQAGLSVRRDLFDEWLAQQAQDAGAELRDGTAAVSCTEQDGYVCVEFKDGGTTCEETAKAVIVCEGAAGSIRRKMRGISGGNVITCQSVYEGKIDLDAHYFYAYLQPEFSDYDAWFNVKDNKLVFGVAVDEMDAYAGYERAFLSHMEKEHGLELGGKIKEERWVMPRITPGCPLDYGEGKILFAGETAGFLNPMGEGISCALESGYAAANAICDVFSAGKEDEKDALVDEYRKNSQQISGYMLGQWDFVARISPSFAHMRKHA